MAMSLDRPAIDTNDGTDAENKERCEGCGEGTMVSLIIVASQVEVCIPSVLPPPRPCAPSLSLGMHPDSNVMAHMYVLLLV